MDQNSKVILELFWLLFLEMTSFPYDFFTLNRYAADGYARACGVGACAVTFTVGGLSVINAIAGAYSENLPLICIVGGPNSNDYGTNRILHHTIGLPDFSQEIQCFRTVTCYQVWFSVYTRGRVGISGFYFVIMRLCS